MAAAAEPSRESQVPVVEAAALQGELEVEVEPPQAVVEGRDDEAAALALEGEKDEVGGAGPPPARCLQMRWCPAVESENLPRIEYTMRCVMGTALLCALFFRPEAGVSLGLSGYAPGAASNAAFFTVMTMEQTLGRSYRSLVVFVVAIVVAGSICAALRAAVPYRELLAASWLGLPFRRLTTCPWILSFVSNLCAPHTQRCGARPRPSLCCS
jgi:hypothetical protein